MALTYVDLDIEIREISLKRRPESLYSISSKGTVPVLQTNNKVIDESIEIMKWAFSESNKKSLDANYKEQIDLVNKNDTKFKHWLDRYKYFDRYLEHSKDYYLNKCSFYLNEYEVLLKNNKYLFSDNIDFADLAILPFVRQYANVDPNHFNNTFKLLNFWLDSLIDSKLFNCVMQKYPLWVPGNKPLIINFKNYE